MAQLLIRKIPDTVMNDIRTAAAAEGISVEEFARRALRDQAETRNQWGDFLAWSARFTQAQPRRRGTSTTDLIRKDRAR